MKHYIQALDRLIKMDQDSPKRILVIGDEIVDLYIHGKAERSQDGCQKFVERYRVMVCGGAALAANCLSGWSVKCRTLFQEILGNIPVKTRFVGESGEYLFRHDKDLVDSIQQKVTRNIGKDEFRNLFNESLFKRDDKPDGVLISDYDKGMLEVSFISEVIRTCHHHNIPVVADAKREPVVYKGAVIKANSSWGKTYLSDAQSWSLLVKTVFRKGSYVETCANIPPTVWDGEQLHDMRELDKLPPVPCTNHVGAGDCFSAHLILGLSYGLTLKESVAIAHSAGRVYVQHSHNTPPRLNDIREDLSAC